MYTKKDKDLFFDVLVNLNGMGGGKLVNSWADIFTKELFDALSNDLIYSEKNDEPEVDHYMNKIKAWLAAIEEYNATLKPVVSDTNEQQATV